MRRMNIMNFWNWICLRKRTISVLVLILTAASVWITAYSNTDTGRNIYKNLFCKQLRKGINKLFHPPNKYKGKDAINVPYGKWNCHVLEDEDEGFEKVKMFILGNRFSLGKINYPIKSIIDHQWLGWGSDHSNPVFHTRIIFFSPNRAENENYNFEIIPKHWDYITRESVLTQNLDIFFTNRIVRVASYLLFFAVILNLAIYRSENMKERSSPKSDIPNKQAGHTQLGFAHKSEANDKLSKLIKQQKWDMSKTGRFFKWILFKFGFSQCRHCIYCETEAGNYRGMRESILMRRGKCEWSKHSTSSDLTYEDLRRIHRCPAFTSMLYNFKDYAINPHEITKIASRRLEYFFTWMGWIVAIFIALLLRK